MGNDPVEKSKWAKGDEPEKTESSSKWSKVEESGTADDLKETKKQDTTEDDSDSAEEKMDESRRKFLREVELKVMRFVDKLEQRGTATRTLNIPNEAQKFRQQLIDEYDTAKKKEEEKRLKKERKRGRSTS